jgi:hypothetical protein
MCDPTEQSANNSFVYDVQGIPYYAIMGMGLRRQVLVLDHGHHRNQFWDAGAYVLVTMVATGPFRLVEVVLESSFTAMTLVAAVFGDLGGRVGVSQ